MENCQIMIGCIYITRISLVNTENFIKTIEMLGGINSKKADFESKAFQYGFKSVSEFKKNIARVIRDYVVEGGFLFAMCSWIPLILRLLQIKLI